jgi:orotate phosphoribosyltransferase
MSTMGERVADALYRSGCIKFGTFKIKSGASSPYYIDMARLFSMPSELDQICEIAAEHIRQIMLSERIDKLASIELKGVLILASIACRVHLPCIIMRKEKKTYGVMDRVAGADVAKGDNVLFFDDVVSEGLSKLEGIKPLEELGANVKHIMVVVDREQGGRENLKELGYQLHALARVSEVVSALKKSEKISEQQAEEVFNYIKK